MADNQGTNNDPTQRLENAMNGGPKINPDEQRHYLGTFRERVSLSMTVSEMHSGEYLTAFTNELDAAAEAGQTIFLNGNLGQSTLGPYIRAATMHAVSFTIKNDPTYKIEDADLALVIADKTAINVSTIDIASKHPENTETPAQPQKKSLWSRLFK